MWKPKLRYLLPVGALVGLVIGVFTNSLVAQSPGVNSPFVPVWSIPLDSIKRTYSSVAQLSPGGFATDISTLCGAAGVVTKLTRLAVTARATAVSPTDIYLLKRSNWDVVSPTPASSLGVAYDVNDVASKAATTFYGNGNSSPSLTLGTLIGNIGLVQEYVGNLTTGVAQQSAWTFDYGNRPDKAPTLRSATDCLAINLSGTSQAGNLYDVYWEWTEE